jgi:hypothetical protein|tara:strand:+ start:2731 stop:3804 length:1074 start_codon:yes stop_codon:yes gene_type:complete
MYTVTIEELRKAIPTIGVELTPIIQSEPGCGKTSILGMIEEDLGDSYDYVYVDCPVMDMSDIAMTIPNHNTKSLENYVGSIFKLDNGKPKVILLDEFMKAPKMLQVIFTRLMLERCVGDRKLPEGSIVFGTSNNQSDGVGDTMLAHAGNRVCIMEMSKPSAEEWLPWATDNKVHPLIRAWVHMFPRALHSYRDEQGEKENPYIFNPKNPQLSYCSPRSLAKASVIMDNREMLGVNTTSSALSGTIGASASADMTALMETEKEIATYDTIIKSPTTANVPESISAQLMTIFMLVDKVDTNDTVTKAMTYVKRIEADEMQAIFFTMMLKGKRTRTLAMHNDTIKKWQIDNQVMITDLNG